MVQAAARAFSAWLFQLRGPERGEVVLVQRRIFILPTRAGVLYGFVLLLMLTGSINYALSLGFVLTFLLTSLGITGILHTWRNLAGLRITPARTAPVFAGDAARFRVCIANPTRADRYSLVLTRDKRGIDVVDVPADGSAVATAAVPATRRGLLKPGRLTLFTRFPIGLFHAWAYVDLDTECVVYPRPAPAGLPLPPLRAGGAEGLGYAKGSDDFGGLRQYYPGDSPRHVAWKAAARGQGLLTKQFVGRASAELWLTLDLPPAGLALEDKISRLTRWVLDAHAEGLPYGLELPGTRVPVATGEAHRDRCLETLALYRPSEHAPAETAAP
ncbi:MAG TPA: DUF58 domain-containing protein [Burkholderiales bacterium]|nr:DUF58 domain-containing protein [Burkholderiales bacterium]